MHVAISRQSSHTSSFLANTRGSLRKSTARIKARNYSKCETSRTTTKHLVSCTCQGSDGVCGLEAATQAWRANSNGATEMLLTCAISGAATAEANSLTAYCEMRIVCRCSTTDSTILDARAWSRSSVTNTATNFDVKWQPEGLAALHDAWHKFS